MTWRWVTFFSLAAAAWCANVTGKVAVTDSKLAREKDDSGVVVWLDPVAGAAPATPPATASVAHKKKTFVPHVVALRTNSKVAFPNLDPFFHNAFSNYDGQIFDVGLRPPGSTPEVTFTRPGIVRLFCNIHPTMSAIIVVLPNDWLAVTGSSGQYTISGVPPGDYQLSIFHERALPENLRFLEHRITVPSSGLVLPLISISETGFIAAPHMNKFNRPYPPSTPGGTYIGGK